MDHVLPDIRREWDRRLDAAGGSRRRGIAILSAAAVLAASGLGLIPGLISTPWAPSATDGDSRTAGQAVALSETVAASGGPVLPWTAAAAVRLPASSKSVARDMAFHIAAGNPEVARYAIPYEMARFTGCRIGSFIATIDPGTPDEVQAEKKARGDLMSWAREGLGDDAVAHASSATEDGLMVHVIVAQHCPGWSE